LNRTDPRTAAHELYGFKMALHQIGFLPESEIDQLCLHDMRNYLPGDILAKVVN